MTDTKFEKKEGKMFVGGIKSSTKDVAVRAYFERFGEIESYERPKEMGFLKNNKLKPFCFIVFKEDGVIHEILKQQKTSYHVIDGQNVDVKDNSQHNKERSNRGRDGFMKGGFQQYGGYCDYYNQGYGYDQGYDQISYQDYGYQGYGYDQDYGYGSFQGYGNQGGYGGYQKQGGFQRGGFRGDKKGRGGKRGRGGFGKAQGGRGNHQNSYQPY